MLYYRNMYIFLTILFMFLYSNKQNMYNTNEHLLYNVKLLLINETIKYLNYYIIIFWPNLFLKNYTEVKFINEIIRQKYVKHYLNILIL